MASDSKPRNFFTRPPRPQAPLSYPMSKHTKHAENKNKIPVQSESVLFFFSITRAHAGSKREGSKLNPSFFTSVSMGSLVSQEWVRPSQPPLIFTLFPTPYNIPTTNLWHMPVSISDYARSDRYSEPIADGIEKRERRGRCQNAQPHFLIF